MDKEKGIVACARTDGSDLIARGLDTSTATRGNCHVCKVEVFISASSLALMERGDFEMFTLCNPCTQKLQALLPEGQVRFGIAPGALTGDTPDDRRRRSELLAWGFEELT